MLPEVKYMNLILRQKISTLKSFNDSINIKQHHKIKHPQNNSIEFFSTLLENWYVRSVQEPQIDSSKDSTNWGLELGITIDSQDLET